MGQDDFNASVLREIRDGIAANHTEAMSEALLLRNDMLTGFRDMGAGLSALRDDVARIHGYLAQTAQRFDDHERRIRALEAALLERSE